MAPELEVLADQFVFNNFVVLKIKLVTMTCPNSLIWVSNEDVILDFYLLFRDCSISSVGS